MEHNTAIHTLSGEGPNGGTGVSCSDDNQCGNDEMCVGWDKEVTMTVREKVEEITEKPNESCADCHATFNNGFGHALGKFSSEGRYWEKEHMFSTECVYGPSRVDAMLHISGGRLDRLADLFRGCLRCFRVLL